eukprot:SAG31_NODE_3250_length_4490_cov_3.521977_2_plen_54_part_00
MCDGEGYQYNKMHTITSSGVNAHSPHMQICNPKLHVAFVYSRSQGFMSGYTTF